MKRLFRDVCAVFAATALSMGVTAAAVNDVVDMSNSTHGYVTVNYSSSARLKVGIQYNGGKTVFYDCPSGKDASFSLDKGNGKYTVTLYRNVSGTSYQQVDSKSMNVTVKDSYAPYLVSTSEVQFSKGDTVSSARTPRPTRLRLSPSTTTWQAVILMITSWRMRSPAARSPSTSRIPPLP